MHELRGVIAVLLVLGIGTIGSARATAESTGGWTTFGNAGGREGAASSPLDRASVRATFYLPLEGRITSQILAARDVPARGGTTLYAATSQGRVYAFTENGYVLWSRDFGQLSHACSQLDGYGITGTGAIDTASRSLYVADAFGRLHALDLSTGAERPGWPVRVFDDPMREHVWGALLAVEGRVYVPTGSYCDSGPMQGHVYSVDVSTRHVASWASVPLELGGGGGIWGWGGIAYSARRHSLFVVTGNAFEGGANSGGAFRESAGYGEHLVELSPELDVRAASGTPEPPHGADADFVGSPIVVTPPGCGELVAAVRKDGALFGWRTDDVAAGPLWRLQLEPYDETNPVLAQPAYDPAHNAIVVVTGTGIVRVNVLGDCSPAVAWSRPLRTATENGLPTVAGKTIWVPLAGTWTLAAVDSTTGAIVSRYPLGEPTLTAPTVVDGRLFVGSFAGGIHGFAAGNGSPQTVPAATPGVSGHSSWLPRGIGWISHPDGVVSTSGGRSSRVFPHPALRVVRTSASAGVIIVGSPPPACGCHTRVLWTRDGGRTWRETSALTADVSGSGRNLFWRSKSGASILRVDGWPPAARPIRSRVVVRVVAGTIVDQAAVAGGVAALVSSRVDGRGWDTSPTLVVYRRGRVVMLRLPATGGRVLVRTLQASWPSLIVRGADFDDNGAIVPVVWRSRDGGAGWTIRRG